MELAGKVALVTGGGTGLGRCITLALARQGMRVAVNYSRSAAEAEATAADARAAGVEAFAVAADVADEAAVAAMVSRIADRLGGVDVLVNNAGITRYVPIHDLAAVRGEDFDRIMAVNVKGAFLCAQAVAPGMRQAGAGKIVNIASNSAFTGEGSSIPYAVSKAALVVLTRSLARALAPAVQVNAVAPAWLATRWVTTYLPPEKAQAVLDDPGARPVPLDDVADAVLLFARNDAVTGQTLIVDRGAGVA